MTHYPPTAVHKSFLQDADILELSLPEVQVRLLEVFAKRPVKGRNAHLIQPGDRNVQRLVDLRLVVPRSKPPNGQWKLTPLGLQWLQARSLTPTPRPGLVRL